ncbi:MAG: hypothetical protein HYR76_03585 [Ignavibacteria bacterium]|nr:hypothetical protein [Ignavibacteria bacterium]MBI3766283.1 hypothetical protein [Ignavibacteriales bacterium]
MKITLSIVFIMTMMSIVLDGTSFAQPRPPKGGFENEADSLLWWKYRRFRDGSAGYTREEHEILRLMELKGVRIPIGSIVRVLVRDPSGVIIEKESFMGTVVRKRHQVFYTVRDSLKHDFEYHLFDIDLPREEMIKVNPEAVDAPKGKDPAKKNKRTGASN